MTTAPGNSPRPTLETARLILRRPSLDDLDRWAEMMADPVSALHIGGVQPRPAVWRMILMMIGAWEETGISMFSVIERQTGRWIGRVGPWHPYAWPGTEVGWGLHPDAWGQGFAVEAAAASMDYAVEVLGWKQIVHCIGPDNQRSAAVARRLGSTIRERVSMPAPFAHEVADLWAQTDHEWRANRARVRGGRS